MNFVVIVEPEEANAERIQVILESLERQFEYVLISSPEQAIDIVENKKVDVVISDLEMPVMSGAELFSLIEIISPDTVRVAMTDAKDITKTIAFMNECRTFKVIVKPCRVADDLLTPIHAALAYKQMRQSIKQEEDAVNMGLFSKEQDFSKMRQICEENEQNYKRIQKIFTDMLGDNLALGKRQLEVSDCLKDWYTWVIEEYMKEITGMQRDYKKSIARLTAAYHNPESGCSFQVKKPSDGKIDEEQLHEMIFILHIMAELCKKLLYEYKIHTIFEVTEKAYIFRFQCILPALEKQEQNLREQDAEKRNALIRAGEKCVDALGYRSVILNKEHEVIVNVAVLRPLKN